MSADQIMGHEQAIDSERPAPLLALQAIVKRYGGIRALRGASLVIDRPGVVHALAGENGSGKSTLLGVLSGQVRADSGQILLNGTAVNLDSPVAALRHGIAMVSQETAVALDLTIAENVLLGRPIRNRGRIDWNKTRRAASEVLDRLGLAYDPRRPMTTLEPDQLQMVEIARALSLEARILILDEPTSSLTEDQVQGLFSALRQLTAEGVAVIFVSHRLSEIARVCDEITILRDGRSVAAGPMSDYDPESVVRLMVGKAKEDTAEWRARRRTSTVARKAFDKPLLRVRQLRVDGVLHDIDLEVARGEIVGIAGLIGAGRSDLLRAIFGARPIDGGECSLDGEAFVSARPRTSIARGIGYLPPDRKVQGLVLPMSVCENLTMVSTFERGTMRRRMSAEQASVAHELVARMSVSTPSLATPVSVLSGGNQQKIALGKWLAARSRLLLLDEPTRGVDVGAKAEIHRLLRSFADEGLALLVSSSEYDELLTISDRILVMFRGRIVASLEPEDATEERLAQYAGGHHEHQQRNT